MSCRHLTASEPITTSLPCHIHGYTFHKKLGSGSFAEVYLVKSDKFNCFFVAKVTCVSILEIESKWKAFSSEVASLSRLNHPNIIRLYDHFRERSYFVLILEFCPHGTIQDFITEQGTIPTNHFLVLASQIVQAIAFCHARKVAHRDIKPTNLLIDQYNRIKVADFGFSTAVTDSMETTFCGTMYFAAPEILQKTPYNPLPADVWALGVTFAMMLQGDCPFKKGPTLRDNIINGRYHLSNSIPQGLRQVITKMLAVNAEERPTMLELAQMSLFHQQPPKRVLKIATLSETVRSESTTNIATYGSKRVFMANKTVDVPRVKLFKPRLSVDLGTPPVLFLQPLSPPL